MFGNMFDPASIANGLASGAMLGAGGLANGGLGVGLQNAMGQIWQVNQANQNAAMYNNQLQQQMDMLNAQLTAAQNMQGKQLAQGQQNQSLGALSQLANTKLLGGVLSNMFNGLGGAMGGLFGGLGSALGGGGGAGGLPLNMHSNTGAGISFGSPASAGAPGGGAAGGGGAYTGNPIAAGYNPSAVSAPMLGGRNITNPNAYGGGFQSPQPSGSIGSSMRTAYPTNQGGYPTDPTSVLMRALQGGNFGL